MIFGGARLVRWRNRVHCGRSQPAHVSHVRAVLRIWPAQRCALHESQEPFPIRGYAGVQTKVWCETERGGSVTPLVRVDGSLSSAVVASARVRERCRIE